MADHKGSVLFAGQAYYNAWYLSRALRKLGWKADVLNWDQSETNQNFYHGEDIKFTNVSKEGIAKQISFYKTALHMYDIFHFSNTRGMTFGNIINGWVPTNYPGFDEISLLKHLGKKIVYSHNGCHDGVRLSTFRNLGTTEQPTCNICPWRNNPLVCSDELSTEWGEFRNSMADYQCLLGGNNHDYNINPSVHETPEFYCLDPEFWHPDIIIPDRFKLNYPQGTVKIYHAVGNYDERTDADGVNLKSSHIYLPLLKLFKAIGYHVELIFAKGIPSRDVRFLQVQADIVVDMLTFGFFGANIREAMMLGKTCVCYLRPEWLESMRHEIPEYVDELPVVSATPKTVFKVLVDLIEHPDKRAEIGRKSREFALKWHSAEAGARRFDQIYSALINNLYPPSRCCPTELHSNKTAEPTVQKTEVDDYWGFHTVNSIPFSTAKESLDYLEYRFNEYPMFRELMGLYGNHDGEVVLDYGCGPGNDVVGFLAHTKASKVIGIDVSEKALNLARHRLSLHKFDESRYQLIQASDSHPVISLEDSSVDYIYCEGVLHHTSHPLAILREFHRVLQPGGTACIMVYNRNSIWFHLYTAFTKMILENKYVGLSVEQAFQKNTDGESCPIARCYQSDEFTALCSEAGFMCDFKGGYISKTELDILALHLDQALKSPYLATIHKDFLAQLEKDELGYPVFNGIYAGIGGVYLLNNIPNAGSKHSLTLSGYETSYSLNKNIKEYSMLTPNNAIRNIVMLVGDSRIDRRVLDEARSLNEAGFRTTVIAAPPPVPGDTFDEECYPDVEIIRIDEKRTLLLMQKIDGARLDAVLKDFAAVDFSAAGSYFIPFMVEAIARPAGIYVGHDLPQLPSALVAAAYHRSYLVYDAHELYPAQLFLGSRERMAALSRLDAALAPFADRIITVNQSLASEFARRYCVETPDVILNCPSLAGKIFPVPRTNILREELKIPSNVRILLYQGNLNTGFRNLENLVTAMGLIRSEHVALVLMGRDGGAKELLTVIAQKLRTFNRSVFFRDAVPQTELLHYTASADAGVIPYPSIDLNTWFCTPNKLFEFMVAGLPILANALPELTRFVSGQNIGLNLPMDTPEVTARAIDTFFSSNLHQFRMNAAQASQNFLWEGQGRKVVTIYLSVGNRPSVQSLYQQAKEAIGKGDPNRGKEYLKELLKRQPGNYLVSNQLCECERLCGDLAAAQSYVDYSRSRKETIECFSTTEKVYEKPCLRHY